MIVVVFILALWALLFWAAWEDTAELLEQQADDEADDDDGFGLERTG